MKSSIHLVHHILEVVTALGSVHLGLLAMGHNFFTMFKLAHYETTFGYIFGLCGVLSFVLLFTVHHHLCKCSECDSCGK